MIVTLMSILRIVELPRKEWWLMISASAEHVVGLTNAPSCIKYWPFAQALDRKDEVKLLSASDGHSFNIGLPLRAVQERQQACPLKRLNPVSS